MLKVGVIGAGRMGGYHINLLRMMTDIEFIGFHDTDPSRVKTIEEKFLMNHENDINQLIKKCDALILASPTKTHYNIAKNILEKKKHILIEKPIAIKYLEAKELVEIAHREASILHVGHVERYNGAVLELPKLIDNPYFWESRRSGPGGVHIDVGVIWDLVIHDIDICLRTIKSNVVDLSVSSFYLNKEKKNEDAVSCSIIFENGCMANFIASRVSQKKARTLNISQKSSYIALDFTTQDIILYKDLVFETKASENEVRHSQKSHSERIFIHKENPLEIELKRFLNDIRNAKSSYEENLLDIKTIKVTEDIVKLSQSK